MLVERRGSASEERRREQATHRRRRRRGSPSAPRVGAEDGTKVLKWREQFPGVALRSDDVLAALHDFSCEAKPEERIAKQSFHFILYSLIFYSILKTYLHDVICNKNN